MYWKYLTHCRNFQQCDQTELERKKLLMYATQVNKDHVIA
jgi:hypothetical protein